ncbi:asparagine synthase (glutamine-hydrolyzing) [Pyruvatibacter sp.]
MCGITGFATGKHLSADDARILQGMTDALVHRGPDADGMWSDPEAGVAFGHRRLSIVDLSEAGAQPMHDASGRYVITYNGEIYNFPALRKDLEAVGVTFRGHSDTEVLIEACAYWGIEATLKRLNGIFAFGLWDRQQRSLTLARDHIGIKPLYWAKAGSTLLFASELKSMHAHPQFNTAINRNAVAAFMRFNYIPQPHSIYQGAHKLPPGCYLTCDLSGGAPSEPVIKTYWDGLETAEQAAADPFTGSPEEAVDQLSDLLHDAIGQQMISDVPLGAFLSGGIDSSTVVALMQAQSSQPVRTFSIGFSEEGFNEAHHAAEVAKHLGTDHTELYLSSRDALDVVPQLADMYDEPFADSSQIPTYLVSKLARQHVTVSLSGDGGDELFAGYNRYVWGRTLWRTIRTLPLPVRRLVSRSIRGLSPARWNQLTRPIPGKIKPGNPGDALYKLASVVELDGPGAIYRRLVSNWMSPEDVVQQSTEPPGLLWDETMRERFKEPISRMQATDLMTYLPDDILTKVDRASMATSLEARVPLLDPRLIEFAWRLPLSMKLRDGQSKWALRQVLYRHVPQSLIDRPKMGFGVPVGDWLRGPLRDWAEHLLDEKRLREQGLFDPKIVRTHWEDHLSGRRNWHYMMWSVLMMEAWLDRWEHNPPG